MVAYALCYTRSGRVCNRRLELCLFVVILFFIQLAYAANWKTVCIFVARLKIIGEI